MSKREETKAPFSADIVGSFLRPEELKAARAKYANGEIGDAELKAVEDRLIKELIERQIASGLHVITDGEFRRSYWHLDFMWGLQGIEHIELDHGYFFHGEETTKGSAKLVGKISGENHPFVEHFKYVKQFERQGVVARQTIPAPAQTLAELFRGENGKQTESVYPNFDELVEDLAAAYRTVIRDLYDAGCRNIQFDDCTWGMIVDDDFWKLMAGTGFTVEGEALKYLRVNNLALEGRPADLTINTHVCRGNYHSTYACKGGYDAIAPYLFAHENVDAFYLEFDDERSGGFEPLKYIPADKKVVLGLITTKRAELEDEQAIIDRIKEAEQYIPADRLYLSPQCGFASCEIGNKLTEEEQWEKIALVQKIAAKVFE
uniref:5-methyltetrahydropteroyltriglutamate--homocysteine S-methyltransferase n=1 Tax=Prevotella sp. GTC17259 TaxID=3236795 RepID=A0AB33J5S5_9BACT